MYNATFLTNWSLQVASKSYGPSVSILCFENSPSSRVHNWRVGHVKLYAWNDESKGDKRNEKKVNEGEQRKGRKEENEQKRKRKDSRERKERHPEWKKEKHSESYLCISYLKLTKLNIIISAMLGTLRDKKKHISRMTERSTNKARCRVACLRLTSLIDKQ